MSAHGAQTQDAPSQVSWRAYGLALLPLAAAGWLPWWATALLCGLFGVAVRWPRWEEGRLLLSLLIVGGVATAAVPAALAVGQGALIGLALRYLALFFVVLALGWSATRITDAGRRSRAALGPVLLIGLVAPQPGLLLALAGGVLAGGGRDERVGGRPVTPAPRVWWVAGAALAAAVLLSVLLPRWTVDWAALGTPGTPPSAVQTRPPAAPPPPELTQSPAAPAVPGVQLPFQLTMNTISLPLDVMLLGGLLLLLAGGALMFRFRREGGRRPHLVELLMVASLLLTGALWLAAGVLLSGGDGGGSGTAQQPAAGGGNALGELLGNITARRQIDISGFAQAVLGLSLLMVFALAAVLVWLNWTQPREKQDSGEASLLPGTASAAAVQPALHRVRHAYRQAEAELRGHGRARGAAETPAGYAARLSAADPALAAPLDRLTRAYAPVRYGGRVTDEDAADAEAAARELAGVLPGLPPPHDLPDHSPDDAPDSPLHKDTP
ncbi:hypothetical protein GCM10010841_24880 [Deinococcus aerophilus]|uniref:Protein-glutamine gamma-glutamyltransferase-like C-terminal domain-containing protein n=1 Tax=Deinococcus aerophilus TaxID=522488 RepID=A0ABQ2GWG9_9DEIO|nr:hypothetical protein GCM10010841_24880 [Deinococcus aerophilus]